MTYELLYGAGPSSAASAPSAALPGGTGDTPAGAAGVSVPLQRYLTVYSFDPEVQVGFGAKASEATGKQRININVAWSEELGERHRGQV